MADSTPAEMTEIERRDVEELSAPRSRVVYEVVRRQGDEELRRPVGSLFWSGTAAGVTIMTSVIAEGALRQKIPAGFILRDVISELGYSLGFVMVILGRMQLFTEQTIVTVLPIMADRNLRKLGVAARLWAIVFASNMLGTFGSALLNVKLHFLNEGLLASMLEVCGSLAEKGPWALLLQGVPAGFLMASVAWIKAGVTSGEFWVITALTYTIALVGFTHVVAGSAEAFLLVFAGKIGIGHALGGIIAPALAGNVLGGTGLFALLAHAQVREEI